MQRRLSSRANGCVEARLQHESSVEIVRFHHSFEFVGRIEDRHCDSIELEDLGRDHRVPFIDHTEARLLLEECPEHTTDQQRDEHGQNDRVEQQGRAGPDLEFTSKQSKESHSVSTFRLSTNTPAPKMTAHHATVIAKKGAVSAHPAP